MALPQRTRRLPPSRCNFTFSDCLQLVKPKVTGLSLLTAAAGYRLGSTAAPDLGKFLGTVFCTFLAAAGGSVLNQYLDRNTDSLMSRTASRPLPALRMSPGRVLIAGVILSISATVYLGVWVNSLASLLAGLTLLIYLGAYTPLKRRTPLSTWIGAVAGALPPLIGWTAAGGDLDIRALSLWTILFFWQVPHFLAIAWIRREEYAKAGLRVLTTLDPTGTRTSRQILLHSCLLAAASLVPYWTGLSGLWYLLAAGLLGLTFIVCAILLGHPLSEGRARLILKAGVIYLPCLLIAMVIDRV